MLVDSEPERSRYLRAATPSRLAVAALEEMTLTAERAVAVLPSALSRLPVAVAVQRPTARLVFLAAQAAAVELTEAPLVPLAALEIHRRLHRHKVTMAALLRRQILTTVPAAAAALMQPVVHQQRPAQAVTAVLVNRHQSADRLLLMPVVAAAQATPHKAALAVQVVVVKAGRLREML